MLEVGQESALVFDCLGNHLGSKGGFQSSGSGTSLLVAASALVLLQQLGSDQECRIQLEYEDKLQSLHLRSPQIPYREQNLTGASAMTCVFHKDVQKASAPGPLERRAIPGPISSLKVRSYWKWCGSLVQKLVSYEKKRH